MPLPFLLVGLGAAALGIGGHLDAKEKNERAQKLADEAQEMYNKSKHSLELAQEKTENSLLKLGYNKKHILDSSMKQFLDAYDKIKHIQVKESVGLNELSKFAIDQRSAIEIREMTNIYSSAIQSGATGAATGAIVALAASGSLPIVTGGLSAAGSILMSGNIGIAAGVAGHALSMGAAMTPLAAVVAPVVLFTGISASMKADENLEKANTMYAEAEEAVEKMKVSETLCNAIDKRSEMFDKLLSDLNEMFAECTKLLTCVVSAKEKNRTTKDFSSHDFSEEEIKLIAVSRALAGAIKAVIDTPILSQDGNISDDSERIYNQTQKELPNFSKNVEEVKNIDYKITSGKNNTNKSTSSSDSKTSDDKLTAKDWIILAVLIMIAIFLITQWWFWAILIAFIVYRLIKKSK